jgi:hypothetical protein
MLYGGVEWSNLRLALQAKLGKSVKVPTLAKNFPGSWLKTFSQLLPDP